MKKKHYWKSLEVYSECTHKLFFILSLRFTLTFFFSYVGSLFTIVNSAEKGITRKVYKCTLNVPINSFLYFHYALQHTLTYLISLNLTFNDLVRGYVQTNPRKTRTFCEISLFLCRFEVLQNSWFWTNHRRVTGIQTF